MPLFEGLSDDELAQCAERFEEVEILAGGMVQEDDFSYRFFIVLEGEADALQDFEHIATLRPGDYFGEMGLVSGERAQCPRRRQGPLPRRAADDLRVQEHGRRVPEHRRSRRGHDRLPRRRRLIRRRRTTGRVRSGTVGP